MNIFDLLADYIVRFRRPILVATAAFTLACLALTPGLDFNFTPQQLFESRSGAQEYPERFAERFGREDNVITLLIHGEDLLHPKSQGPVRDLTYELRQLDHVTGAQSVATMTVPRPVRGPPVSAQDAQALVIIFGLMIYVFRSLKIGLLATLQRSHRPSEFCFA